MKNLTVSVNISLRKHRGKSGRKLVMSRTRELYELRERLSLNSLQRSVLVGTLLGDGALLAASSGHADARLQIEHMAAHRDYVIWTYEIFKEWVLTPPFWRVLTNSWRFRTISHAELGAYRALFYNGKQKVVPIDIDKMLDQIALSVWLMDDGGMDRQKTYTISVHSFVKQDVEKLQGALQSRWRVDSIPHYEKGKGYRLYVRRRSAVELQSLIMPNVHPCMRSKLSLTP